MDCFNIRGADLEVISIDPPAAAKINIKFHELCSKTSLAILRTDNDVEKLGFLSDISKTDKPQNRNIFYFLYSFNQKRVRYGIGHFFKQHPLRPGIEWRGGRDREDFVHLSRFDLTNDDSIRFHCLIVLVFNGHQPGEAIPSRPFEAPHPLYD